MPDLALSTADELHLFDSVVATQKSAPAGEDITAGELITLRETTGDWMLADVDSAGDSANVYVAGLTVEAGQGLTGFKTVKADGYDLDDYDFNDPMYLSGTAGQVSDAGSVVIARVVTGHSELIGSAPKKILQFAIPL